MLDFVGVPGRTRTCDLRIRCPLPYFVERPLVGFTFAIVRPTAKLVMSWSNMAPMHVGGPSSLASVLGADWQILKPRAPFAPPSPQSYRHDYRCPHRSKQDNEQEPSRQRKTTGKRSECREKKQLTDASVIPPQFHSRRPLAPKRGYLILG
jgi:hypothetical protein